MIAPLRVVWCGIQLGEEFPAGWEGWLEGAHQAQLSFGLEDSVCVAVLRVERNGFSVLAYYGGFLCTGPWHHDGWVDNFSCYFYFGRLV